MGTFLRQDEVNGEEHEVEYIEPNKFSILVFNIQEIIRILMYYYLVGLGLYGVYFPYKIGHYFGSIIKGFKDALI